MDYEHAAATVAKNYIFERIVNSTVSTLSEPMVKSLVMDYLRWHPVVWVKIQQGTMTLPELLGILDVLDDATRAKIDQWVKDKTNKSIADLIVDARNFEQRLPEGAEAVRVMVLHHINRVYG